MMTPLEQRKHTSLSSRQSPTKGNPSPPPEGLSRSLRGCLARQTTRGPTHWFSAHAQRVLDFFVIH